MSYLDECVHEFFSKHPNASIKEVREYAKRLELNEKAVLIAYRNVQSRVHAAEVKADRLFPDHKDR